jgi:hypothetical protein
MSTDLVVWGKRCLAATGRWCESTTLCSPARKCGEMMSPKEQESALADGTY